MSIIKHDQNSDDNARIIFYVTDSWGLAYMYQDVKKFYDAAFFDSRDHETLNDMCAQARRQLIQQRQMSREELQRLQMKFPHLTDADR